MRDIILWIIVSYLIGSLPTGYVVTKLFHKDENGKRDGLDIRTRRACYGACMVMVYGGCRYVEGSFCFTACGSHSSG